jgi:hypothetical protein
MKSIQVLRIETDNGIGVFTNNSYGAYDIVPEACKRHFSLPENCTDIPFPLPQMEGLKMNKYDAEWFCAFLSIDQLGKLFLPNEIKTLLGYGYNILLLTVTEYQKGKHQVVFTRDSIVETQNINSLF